LNENFSINMHKRNGLGVSDVYNKYLYFTFGEFPVKGIVCSGNNLAGT